MKAVRSVICIILALSIVLFSVSGCGKKDNNAKPADNIDDSVTIKLPVSKTDSFNPYKAETEFNSELATLLFDGLVKVNSDLSVSYVIASSVEVSGKTVKAVLRDKMYFSNGMQLTADDVVYSFKQAAASANYEKRLANFTSASRSSDNEVIFELAESDIYSASCLDFPVMQRPSHAKIADDDISSETDEQEDTEETVIGSGRYKFEDESHNTLIMNEYWYGEELPEIRRIELVNLLNLSDAVNSMETGNISYLFQDLSTGKFNRVNAKTTSVLMTNLVFLGINSYSTALAKPEVRQAISLVIDKDSIVKNSFLGYAVKADTPFYPEWKELKNIYLEKSDIKSDIYEAEQLLDKAGYADKTDLGMRESEDLKLKLVVNSDNAYKSAAADEIALCLKKIGIQAEVSKLTWDEYINALANVDYDIYIGEVKLTNNMSLSSFFTSEGAVSYGINQTSAVVDKYKSFRAGKISLQRFTDYFNVSVPFVPLCYRTGIAAYTNELSYSKEGNQSDIFAGIYTWKY